MKDIANVYDDTNLADFGWRAAFERQLADMDDPGGTPARVLAVHRSTVQLAGPSLEMDVPPPRDLDGGPLTVGDWVLVEAASGRVTALFDRISLFRRRAAGTESREQLLAANVDTLFVVSSCNNDFNEARLERYLAVGRDAGVMSVIVLTKADLCDDPGEFASAAGRLAPGLVVETVDARNPDSLACLESWLGSGQTVAMLGSSGVGKSTIANTFLGDDSIATCSVREGDDRGRHTTTTRQMYRLPGGAWLVDTPGMRELQLTDVRAGLDDVFAEITALAAACRFADCAHESEPGCAVNAAVDSGALDAERLQRWRKLAREEALNRTSIAERRARDKATGRLYKSIITDSQRRKGRKEDPGR